MHECPSCAQELPESLCCCVALVKLDVSYNSLRELPSALGVVRTLQRLIVSNNQLTRVPFELGNLRALKEFDLRCMHFTWEVVSIMYCFVR